MTIARDLMTPRPQVVKTDQTAADAARLMAEQSVGALPICGKDDKIKGVVTDRDIVIKVIAKGRDAGGFPAGDLNQDEAVTVGADDPADEVLATMTRHQVRRLPVIDGDRLVGMIALADVVRALPDRTAGDLAEVLSSDF
ncbi:CBS domain-containing protein [Amycolatopsis aidingensis]|uniref:CBS domain-containing protein n=1 Tax=Amycolatopsis aidingensis TaxID=2842453 RepID=UPI001C0D7767|nr:CBS domain-containing protein [Amycolatopsis aidingensis]